MIYTRPEKCRYGIPSHTVPLQALVATLETFLQCTVIPAIELMCPHIVSKGNGITTIRKRNSKN